MKVRNVHEREYPDSLLLVGALIDSLATGQDRLWPTENWPRMQLNKGLCVGARGGHGPIRYYVERYASSRAVTFRFLAPSGFSGTHSFEVNEANGKTTLRHVLEMHTQGWALLSWPVIFRPLHDALIEDSLDKASASLGQPLGLRRSWSLYVKVLRGLQGRISRSADTKLDA